VLKVQCPDEPIESIPFISLSLIMREIFSIEIADEAQVGAARRAVHEYASRLGFTEKELAEIDIVVQELGTNAATYATQNSWLHYTTTIGRGAGLELFYWDAGPGIYNIDRAVRDGVSTSGSLGTGLGAIRRLMDQFDLYSTVRTTSKLSLTAMRRTSHGTAVLARKWKANARPEVMEMARVGVWSRPHPGQQTNGDAYLIKTHGPLTLFAVIDGLGHGHGARQASDTAIDSLSDWMGEPLEEVFMAVHGALRSTRGAVMGVAVVDGAREEMHFAGVGNVSVRTFNTPEHATPIPSNGTLGARMGRVRVWTQKWAEESILIMASDGLSETWDIRSYPTLLERNPQLMAGILMRDYSRPNDDATVLVAK
jgi:anti-sigma regulatory factor (Ser/Thr protein kinase)/serine/threonine protein phosphatase PrpC